MTVSSLSLMTLALAAVAETETARHENSFAETALEVKSRPDVSVKHSCPYGNETESRLGGVNSFTCHGFATGGGTSCPNLQTKRLKTARAFQISNHASFLKGVGGYPLSPVFDKSIDIRGDETYEELLKLHIKGLLHDDMEQFEDKIYLKKLAAKLGIPTTTMYFGVHKEQWKAENFKKVLADLCQKDVDDFMIKATHLAWSAGQKIVTDFQKDYCQQTSQVQTEGAKKFTTFIWEKILNQEPNEGDEHLHKLKPGVTVEALFKTGGDSTKPLEAKVQVLWGKVHHIFFFGMDHRGCKVNVGTWQIYGDKTGWDLKGIIKPGGGNDELGDRVLEEAYQTMVNYAERFARSLEADFMRVDFFLRAPESKAGGDWVIEMNECESVTGMQHTFERQGLGEIWRDGYIMSRLAMTPTKYQEIRNNTQKARDTWKLDD